MSESDKRFVIDRIGGANGPGWYVREVANGGLALEKAVGIARHRNEMATLGAEEALRMEVARVRYHRRQERNGVEVHMLDQTVRVERRASRKGSGA